MATVTGRVVSQRQFLKTLTVAVGLAGLGQVVAKPRSASAQDFNEDVNVNGKLTVTGNVGIGTTSPSEKLEVRDGNIRTNGGVIWGNGACALVGGAGGGIEIGNSLTPGVTPYIDFHYGTGVHQDFNVRIINNGDGRLAIEGIQLRVGIGNNTPTERLDVAGNIRLSGALIVKGVVAVDANGVAQQSYYA